MFRTRRGLLWMIAGAAVAILAGIAAMLALRSAISTVEVPEVEGPLTRPVVVATRFIPKRSVLSEADVEIRELPEDAIRSGAVVKIEDAVGRITLTEFNQGEIVLAQNLLTGPEMGEGEEETEVSIAEALNEDEVAVGLLATDLMSRFGILHPGDKVDLVFSVNVVGKTYEAEVSGLIPAQQTVPQGGLVSFTAVQDLEILQIVAQKTAAEGEEEEQPVERLIILIADPQEAVILKYLKDSGGVIDFALRAPTSEQLFEVEPVTINYLAEKYGIIPPEPLD